MLFLALNFGKTASSFGAAVFHVACIFVVVTIVVKIECNLSKTSFTRTNVRSYTSFRQLNRLHQLNVSDALTWKSEFYDMFKNVFTNSFIMGM